SNQRWGSEARLTFHSSRSHRTARALLVIRIVSLSRPMCQAVPNPSVIRLGSSWPMIRWTVGSASSILVDQRISPAHPRHARTDPPPGPSELAARLVPFAELDHLGD